MMPTWVLRIASRASVWLWFAQDAAEARSTIYATENHSVRQKVARAWSTCLRLLGGLLR
jgi:hypothetical protein